MGKFVLSMVMVWWIALAGALQANAQTFNLPGPSNGLPQGTAPLPGPLTVAGDGDYLWLLRPAKSNSGTGTGVEGFQYLIHPAGLRSGSGGNLWQLLADNPGLNAPFPQCIAVTDPAQTGPNAQHTLFQILPGGRVRSVNPHPGSQRDPTETNFPAALMPVAAAGMPDGIYVLARGPSGAASQPATLPTTASAPATSPISATTAPASLNAAAAQEWTLWLYAGRRWTLQSTLGTAGATGVPSTVATARITRSYDLLALVWSDLPALGNTAGPKLSVRLWDPATSRWSDTMSTSVEHTIRSLHAFTIAPQAFIFWPEETASDAPIILRGGALPRDGSFDAALTLTLNLGKESIGVNRNTEVAVGPIGNTISVLFSDASQPPRIHSLSFTRDGSAIAGMASAVDIASGGSPQAPFVSSIVMLLLISLLAVSLWQYHMRQSGSPAVLKKNLRVARVSRRVAAAVIDLAIPSALVLQFSGIIDGTDRSTFDTLKLWLQQWLSWQSMGSSVDLMLVMALYIVHVTIGEWRYGRSAGKAILHIKVVTLDGAKPTAAAIVLRNIIRVFEMIPGVLLIFMLINENRQRIGDLFARTIVIDTEPLKGRNRPE